MKLFNVILFLILALLANYALLLMPYDNTDDVLNETRSGMSLYTDNLTGCQYLKAGFFGGIVPRVNGNGRHIGCAHR